MVIETGDIANRMEVVSNVQVQSAAASWAQFSIDYINGLNLFDQSSNRGALWLAPGNHDVSNAIGYYTAHGADHRRHVDGGDLQLMLNPAVPLTASTYNNRRQDSLLEGSRRHSTWRSSYVARQRRAGVARERPRGGNRARPCSSSCTDPPAVDSKHFINPNGLHDINTVDKFENLLWINSPTAPPSTPVDLEQRAFATFLKAHKNVVAYFHGHTNYTQYYDWNGPDGDVVLHAIRVDSPMKGNYSATDETQLLLRDGSTRSAWARSLGLLFHRHSRTSSALARVSMETISKESWVSSVAE